MIYSYQDPYYDSVFHIIKTSGLDTSNKLGYRSKEEQFAEVPLPVGQKI